VRACGDSVWNFTMYNGIGLSTPRGSGTNGYIQTNKFFVKSRPVRSEAKEFQAGQGAGGVLRKAIKDILEHDRKRRIELKLIELEDQLVDQGYPDEEVLGRVEALRKGLEAAGAEDGDDASAGLDSRYGTVLCSWYTCM
jgi:serine/arginine repetitive matrix protein 2